MTDRLYYNDPGLIEFDATVTSIQSDGELWLVALDRSAFYPTSGGQAHDTGLLAKVPVVDVTESPEGEIIHHVTRKIGAVGDSVHGQVDPDRRRRARQSHTAQHILSAAFVQLAHLDTQSMHLGEEYNNIELPARSISSELLRQAEDLSNAVIADAVPVEILSIDAAEAATLPLRKAPNRKGTLRIMKIGDLDYSACGGTHCSNTAEVGLIKIVGTERIRGRTAVRFLAGDLARADYRVRFDVSNTISRALTCHPTDLPHKVEKLTGEVRDLRKQVSQLQNQMLAAKAEALIEENVIQGKPSVLVADVSDVSPDLLGALAGEVLSSFDGVCFLVAKNRAVLAVSESSKCHAGKLARLLAADVGLKGGGNAVQAQFGGADKSRLDEYATILKRLVADA